MRWLTIDRDSLAHFSCSGSIHQNLHTTAFSKTFLFICIFFGILICKTICNLLVAQKTNATIIIGNHKLAFLSSSLCFSH